MDWLRDPIVINAIIGLIGAIVGAKGGASARDKRIRDDRANNYTGPDSLTPKKAKRPW